MSYQNQSRGGNSNGRRDDRPPPRHPAPPGGWPLPAELEGRRRAQALEAIAELQMVRTFVAHEFVEGVDYGIIPGTQKPSLWQPGAQKLLRLFRATPDYRVEQTDLPVTIRRERGQEPEQQFGHCRFKVHCRLVDPAGRAVGAGLGVASTLEEKFRYKRGRVRCPKCEAEAIFKSKPPRTGWWCAPFKGGCGANFADGDPAIEDQDVGRVETDPAEQWNTVLGIARKRAEVDAAKTIAAVSDFLEHRPGPTWDLSETPPDDGPRPADDFGRGVPAEPPPAPAPAAPKPPPEFPATVEGWYEAFRPRAEALWAKRLAKEPALAGPAADPIAPPGPWAWGGFANDLFNAALARPRAGDGCEPGRIPDDDDAPDAEWLAALRVVYDLDPPGLDRLALDVVGQAVAELRRRAARRSAAEPVRPGA